MLTPRTSHVVLTGTVALALLGLAPVAAAGDPPTCNGVPATIVGTDSGEDLVGTSGNDVIVGGAGGHEIFAMAGDDIICGGDRGDQIEGNEGSDLILGRGGDDYIYADEADELVAGGPDNDVLRMIQDDGPIDDAVVLDGGQGRNSLTFAGDAGVVVDVTEGTITGAVTVEFSRITTFVLTSAHDVFRGGPAAEQIYGTDGGDDLSMGGGNDNVQMTGSPSSRSRVRMGPGKDEVIARGGGIVWLGPGDDRARVGVAIDLRGGPGNDRIQPVGPSRWSASGGSGNDVLTFTFLSDPVRVDVAEGDVVIRRRHHAIAGFDRYIGTAKADKLLGGPGRDVIRGKRGNDLIRGRAGDDELVGDRGVNVIRGGAGHDVCSPGRDTQGCELFH